ncbi:MAG TPA: thiamine-phosphate kinase [Thermoanaerobaculia bacterium]|nr:thiamine-phosphate kinase [Thermoanaerobaculia bacterium]
MNNRLPMGAEDLFVERLRALLPAGEGLRLGPGDDAAVVATSGRDMMATTDLLVEGVDFLPDADLEGIGRRAVSVNLSDAAAMGARPRFFLLSIVLPEHRGEEDALAICRGAIARGAEFGASLAGGDLSRGPKIVLSVALWGELDQPPVTRSGGRAGDALYLTGFPGRAAAGLRIAASRARRPGLSAGDHELLDAYVDPAPRVEFSLAIAAAAIPRAAIDVSDGLGIDAGRLARSSGVRAVVDRDRLPVSPALRDWARREGADVLGCILAGGDDYELLFAASPEAEREIGRLSGDLPVARIGRLEEGRGAFLRDEGGEHPIDAMGYDHLEARR